MKKRKPLVLILAIILTISLLPCTFAYAEENHPIIESFTGPTSFAYPGPDTFQYRAVVKGGTPPYTYKWQAGATTLLEGKGDSYSNPTFKRDNLAASYNGKGYYMRLYVTDANGNPATWVDEKGKANTLFIYAVENGNPEAVKKYPEFPYKSAGASKPAPTTAPAPAPVDDRQFATFSSISGEVKYRPGDQPEGWGFAKNTTKLYSEYHVKTGEDSGAIIGFDDLSTYYLKAETEIIVSFPTRKDSKLGLVAGNIWVNVKKMLKDGSMQVDMSQATLGIKGTTFVLSEVGGKSTLKVIEGTVEIKSKTNPTTKSVAAGEAISANNNGLSEKTKFDAVEENNSWEKFKNSLGKSSKIYIYIGIGVAAVLIIVILIFIGKRKKKKSETAV